MNYAVMNICLLVFVCAHVFISLGSIAKSDIAGSYDNSMFNHLKNCYFPKQLYHFTFPQQFMKAPISPHLHQHRSSFSLFRSILPSMKWYSIVGLICISPTTYDVWASFHVLIGLLCIFFGELSIQILCPFFWIGLFVLILTVVIYIF